MMWMYTISDRIGAVLGFALLMAAMVFSLEEVNRQRNTLRTNPELSYVPSGEYLKIAVFGYRSLAADFMWLTAVHLAGRNQSREGYLHAYRAVEATTDLDPSFVHAYQASGTILSVWARMPMESVAILKKGTQHNPTVWELPFFLGYDYFYELHDPETAAQYFRQAATLPNAPPWLGKLAARMTVEAGDPDSALEFLKRLYAATADERTREGLMDRMREVEAERRIRILEGAAKQYRERYGVFPKDLNDLARRGILATIPDNPLGGQFVIRESDGAVVSTTPYQRLRVHRE